MFWCEKGFMLMGIWIVGSLPNKEEFYGNLSMKDITEADYKQSECKSEILSLPNVFVKFGNRSIVI